MEALEFSDPLLISDRAQLSHVQSIPAIKLKQTLGQEYDTLIWDGFSSLNPDALGIASGLLKGGGLFFLLLPPLDKLVQQADPDYLRMCTDESVFKQCHTHFLQRLVKHLQSDPALVIYAQGKPARLQKISIELPAAAAPGLPTQDQLEALTAIIKVAKGHRYRPLVLQADRGRGKSSVLGMAAAHLFIQHACTIAISAPDKQTCHAAFQHYRRLLESHFSCPERLESALAACQFVAIDQLLQQSSQFQLLMIDEAAAMPAPLLKRLLAQHPRLVFATTVHGYEGHGQGFAIRFKEALDTTTPQWKSVTLKTPVRWAENDPLEAWFFRFLLLNAAAGQAEPGTPCLVTHKPSKVAAKTNILWLSQATLAEDEPLFASIFSLLVNAHYQTKPSDIRLILDHPHIRIAVAFAPDKAMLEASSITGVLLMLEEGGLMSGLGDEIITGKRRPRGHLFAQALCASTGRVEFMTQRSYRITRVAVNADVRQQGTGSALLTAVRSLAQENQIDYLSTSFGLRPELLSFWHKNQFDIVKLGLHADGASGTQSIMLMAPLSERAKDLGSQIKASFTDYFLFNLPRLYQDLDTASCLVILKTLTIKLNKSLALSAQTINNLRAYAFANRSFEESNLEIYHFVLSSLSSPHWHQLDDSEVDLLILKVLQTHDNDRCRRQLMLRGKKEMEARLRTSLQKLLVTETSQQHD